MGSSTPRRSRRLREGEPGLGWRVDKQNSVRVELPDAGRWMRVKFWGIKSLVGFRYGVDHHAIVGAFIVHVDDETAPGACSHAFEQWAQPWIDSFEVTVHHEPPKAVPWEGKIADIDSLVATTATLGDHEEYAVAYATYPAWRGTCLVLGVAVPARDEIDRAKAVRDRFAGSSSSRPCASRRPSSPKELY